MRTRSVLAAWAAPVLIAGAALGLGATSASAAQTNFKIPPGTQIPLGPAVCAPGFMVFTVVSGHDNVTAGHENSTIVGTVVTVDQNGNVLATGKGEAWFTNNDTNGASVDTDAINVKIGGIGIHLHGTAVTNANGVPVVNNQNVVCS